MALMGGLYLGTSGITASQNALNTTAHNLANVDTKGYTRQQVVLNTSPYNTTSKTQCAISYSQFGLGVTYAQTRTVRDYFLDKNYRREEGRSAFYDVSVEAMDYVEDILGESAEGQSFSTSISDLWTSIEELTKDPTNEVNQNLLVTRCYEFITNAGNVYQSLCDYQNNLNTIIKNNVNDINQKAQRLEFLNNEIVKIEAAGFETANDLRDERESILDDLAKYGNITWNEDEFGFVSVQFEGNDLVKNGLVHEIGLYENSETGLYSVYWVDNAKYYYDENGEKKLDTDSVSKAQVFDLTADITSEMNTDVGSLRGVLLARGDHAATYEDLSNEDQHYDKEISQSVIMNVQAEFDQLINKIVTKINGILEDAANAAEQKYPGAGYLKNEDGSPIQLFTKIVEGEGWTTKNTQINQELRQTPSLLGFRLPDGSEDQNTMELLKSAFKEDIYTLNPNVATPMNFRNYYSSLVTQVSNSGSVYKAIQNAQDVTVNAVDSAREQILGVSSDEELTFMIMYQNAYNASSRYLNVVSQMIEHLVTTLGS